MTILETIDRDLADLLEVCRWSAQQRGWEARPVTAESYRVSELALLLKIGRW
jgi:hypothetical protein